MTDDVIYSNCYEKTKLLIVNTKTSAKVKPKNLNSPDWREHPPVFFGRCGRKAGIWKAGKARAIRSKKSLFLLWRLGFELLSLRK